MESQEKIELTNINNVEDILKLYPEADEEQLAKIKSDATKDIENAERGERIIWGANKGGKIVGTVQLVFKGTKDFYADGKLRAHIHHARVAENLRGRGIGTQLIQRVEAEAKGRGFIEMTLGVEETNRGAIGFYKRLGYHEFMREKGDEGEIIIGMKKEL